MFILFSYMKLFSSSFFFQICYKFFAITYYLRLPMTQPQVKCYNLLICWILLSISRKVIVRNCPVLPQGQVDQKHLQKGIKHIFNMLCKARKFIFSLFYFILNSRNKDLKNILTQTDCCDSISLNRLINYLKPGKIIQITINKYQLICPIE